MNQTRAGAALVCEPAGPAADLSTTIGVCAGCGYPKFGPGLCAYCRPVLAL